jgi:DNA topoisomerase I
MEKTLIIVESPIKAKKISEYLNKNYTVVASGGHITDLAKGGKHGLGVDVERNFSPRYVILDDKMTTLEMLVKEAAAADQILLGCDDDREGCAIAWHLNNRLEDLGKPIKVIEFHEITKKAIQQAIKSPGQINLPRFRSQEARRIVDRLVGFMVSPFLMHHFGAGLSAGRVQSVVAKMIVDREREIEAFQSEEYWVIQAKVANRDGQSFVAKYEPKIVSAETAAKVKQDLEQDQFRVLDVIAAEEKKKPLPPLITSKLQQVMSKNYGMSADRTMRAAQSLYENGYCTYIRTDSVRANEEAIKEARAHLREQGHSLPKSANVFLNNDTAQDAHECIRPTDLTLETINVSPDEQEVYQVIRTYFLASQMLPAVFSTLKVSLQAQMRPEHLLKSSGKCIKSLGFLSMFPIKEMDDKINIPSLVKNEVVSLFGEKPITAEQKWTQPPARYSEAHLLETLDKKNIGRPSTYAELLSKITTRDYVEKRGNVFHPTELGKQITDELVKFFSFMEYDYTRDLELSLDEIATGAVSQLKILQDFFVPFNLELTKAYSAHGAEICAECQSPMILRTSSKDGNKFLGCLRFPRCKFIKKIPILEKLSADAVSF